MLHLLEIHHLLSQPAKLTKHLVLFLNQSFSAVGTFVVFFAPFDYTLNMKAVVALSFEVCMHLNADAAFL